jgi:hypothetical protein
MNPIEKILRSPVKPPVKQKEKQLKLVKALVSQKIPTKDFITFFESASDVDKGTCADVMKHVGEQRPELLVPFINVLVKYINYKAPRVKWGIPEAIGNMAKAYPQETAKAIPFLLKNTTDDAINTTVIKWCAAFALTEIAKHNPRTRKNLLPIFEERIRLEKNNGVKNVYVKAVKEMGKES